MNTVACTSRPATSRWVRSLHGLGTRTSPRPSIQHLSYPHHQRLCSSQWRGNRRQGAGAVGQLDRRRLGCCRDLGALPPGRRWSTRLPRNMIVPSGCKLGHSKGYNSPKAVQSEYRVTIIAAVCVSLLSYGCSARRVVQDVPGQRMPGGIRLGADGQAICNGTLALASYMLLFRHIPCSPAISPWSETYTMIVFSICPLPSTVPHGH